VLQLWRESNSCTFVYPLAADNSDGPLASRLCGVTQPVLSTPHGFSKPRSPFLTCICAHCRCEHHAYQSVAFLRPSAAVAPGDPDRVTPLAATTRARSVRPSALADAAATPWRRPCRWLPQAQPEAGAHSHGATRNCGTPGRVPAAGASRLHSDTLSHYAAESPRPAAAGSDCALLHMTYCSASHRRPRRDPLRLACRI
jgi:hypothetical protein